MMEATLRSEEFSPEPVLPTVYVPDNVFVPTELSVTYAPVSKRTTAEEPIPKLLLSLSV